MRPQLPSLGPGGVVFCAPMTTLACLMHWYISALYVAPVLAVGGWGWWSTRKMAQRSDSQPNIQA
jgi:hypothetical protein